MGCLQAKFGISVPCGHVKSEVEQDFVVLSS